MTMSREGKCDNVWVYLKDRCMCATGQTLGPPDDKIIANPNCSTIQMVVALAPLHREYTLKRLVISTYQSITGTGVKAVKQMENERINRKGEMAYPHEIDKNCIPQCDDFMDNGSTKEEMRETNY